MYKSIVLAYDGTAEGRKALLEGAEIAKHFKTKTCVLAVVNKSAAAATAQGMVAVEPGEQTVFYQSTLKEGVNFFREHGLDATGYVKRGDPVSEILKLADEVHADLVVVGHRSRGPLARWWITPTSMSLLDKIKCSVLICMNETE